MYQQVKGKWRLIERRVVVVATLSNNRTNHSYLLLVGYFFYFTYTHKRPRDKEVTQRMDCAYAYVSLELSFSREALPPSQGRQAII